MTIVSEKNTDLRKRLSIELCDNFVRRLNPKQSKEIKIGALIAIKNLIKESNIEDPFLYNYLIDTIVDPDKEVRKITAKVIKETINPLTVELLQTKLQEVNPEVKKEIRSLLQDLTQMGQGKGT